MAALPCAAATHGVQAMEALVRCHEQRSIARWWGACNDAKVALTKCLAEEKRVLRAERQERARQQHRQRMAQQLQAAAARSEQQQQQQNEQQRQND
jgi:Cytochrome c oxidase biogenesis protein Cmc1 like